MPLFKYEPYYQYNGASLANPFCKKLEKDEIENNLESFFNEIDTYFQEKEANIEKLKNGLVEITTDMTEDNCDERVKLCLNHYDLFANKS